MRKLFLPILGLLLWAIPASAQITLVHTAFNTTSGGISTPFSTSFAGHAFSGTTTSGNTIIFCVGAVQASGSTNSISSVSGQGGSLTVVTGSLKNYGATTNFTNAFSECAYLTGITGGATTALTVTLASSVTRASLDAIEVTALGSGTSLSNAGSGTGTAVSAGSVTSTVNGAFFMAMMVSDDNGGTVYFGSVGSGWTQGGGTGGGDVDAGSEYQAQATAGALTGNSTCVASGDWTASIVMLQPAISGSGGSTSIGPSKTVGPGTF